MPRNRIIHNVQGLFVGPAPASGYHFINETGILNNQYTYSASNYNLLREIYRVQSVNYSIDLPRTNVLAFGKRGTITNPVISPPTVNIDFSYLQFGVANELRMGFYTNFLSPFYNYQRAHYVNNYQVCLISGFINRQMIPEDNDFGYPYTYRDQRNLFLIVKKDEDDLINRQQILYSTYYSNPNNIGVIGFGNCYITNYQTQASVGGVPLVNVSYIGENITYYPSGSGIPIPAVDKRTRNNITGIYFSVPSMYEPPTGIPSVLLPGDITLDITAYPKISNVLAVYGTGLLSSSSQQITGAIADFRDIKIQAYNINLPMERKPMMTLGFKNPVDRQIQFPVYVNCELNALVGDFQSGTLVDYLETDFEYNLSIKLKTPKNIISNQPIAVMYDFIRAKLNNFSFNNAIGSNKSVNMNFGVELDPDDYSHGFFMSGRLNSDTGFYIMHLLAQEDSDLILQEDDDTIISREYWFIF